MSFAISFSVSRISLIAQTSFGRLREKAKLRGREQVCHSELLVSRVNAGHSRSGGSVDARNQVLDNIRSGRRTSSSATISAIRFIRSFFFVEHQKTSSKKNVP